MSLRLALLLLLLTGLPSAAGAQARDPDLPPIDARGVWHRVAPEDESTTHKCAGDPKTPHCALTTFYACLEREEHDFCRLLEYPGVLSKSRYPRIVYSWYEYHIVTARRLSATSKIDEVNEGPVKPQDGDLLIGLWEKHCHDKVEKACTLHVEKWPLMYFVLRKRGDMWTTPHRFQKRTD